MKTSHQLARELLAGPDLPIILPTAGDPGLPPADLPKVTRGSGYDAMNGGDSEEFLELHPACHPPVFADPEGEQ